MIRRLLRLTNPRRRGPQPSPIRAWSGVIDPAAADDTHVAPLRAQLETGIPHEAEFGFFRRLDRAGLFVDVGANAGQSAASLRCVNTALSILSFEPNPLLEPVLRRLREDVLEDFEYRMVGLSDRRRSLTLYTPVIEGLHVTPLATLDRSLFERAEHHERLMRFSRGKGYEIVEATVRLERMDDLDLDPSVVKIDAEEHEMSCLRGMIETIGRCSPMLMIENNPQQGQIADLLRPMGYEPFLYDPDLDELVPFPAPVTAVNMFYMPPPHRHDGTRSDGWQIAPPPPKAN